MTDVQLYTKLSELPSNLKSEVADFIDFLQYKSKKSENKNTKRLSGKAKGLIKMNDNFEEPIEGFNDTHPYPSQRADLARFSVFFGTFSQNIYS